MALYRFVMTWKKFCCQSGLYLTSLFFFRKIEAKQNKSHRMQNTCTSRSTDFRRQKTIASKTPLTLYGRGFCASDRTLTKTGSPAGPQSNQNVWVLPPISRNECKRQRREQGKLQNCMGGQIFGGRYMDRRLGGGKAPKRYAEDIRLVVCERRRSGPLGTGWQICTQ